VRQQKFRSLSAAHKHTDGIYGASSLSPTAMRHRRSNLKRAATSDLAIGAYYNHSRFSKAKGNSGLQDGDNHNCERQDGIA
jgi:hypothetical protein